jgi:hypothetical protein
VSRCGPIFCCWLFSYGEMYVADVDVEVLEVDLW